MHIYTLLFITLFITACGETAPTSKTLQEVFIVEATEQPYRPVKGFNARIESRSDVNISAQVSGRLIAIHFKEGDHVKMGDPLFDIDPSPFTAALARSNAELSKAQANQQIAEKNFERGKKLVKDGFISESEFDTLEAKKLESSAQTEAAKAALESAKVDLEYTTIKAPLDGKIGRSTPAVGTIISPQYGELTTLVGLGDVDAVFQVPEKLILSAKSPSSKVAVSDIEVSLALQDGSTYSHLGKIDYIANRIDPTTGTIEVRAQIANPEEKLSPGMFVNALLKVTQPLQSLMIPQATVQVDQQGTFVFTIDGNNIVSRKNVATGERMGENVLVNAGLNAGEKIIIRGTQKVRPGDTVTPLVYQPATTQE